MKSKSSKRLNMMVKKTILKNDQHLFTNVRESGIKPAESPMTILKEYEPSSPVCHLKPL
jgi:hypothetical protein